MKTLLSTITIGTSIQTGSAILLTVSLDAALGIIGGVIGTAGGVTGGISSAVSNSKRAVDKIEEGSISYIKRQSYSTKYDWEQYHKELNGTTINFQGEEPGTIVVSGVPTACMNLATVLTGQFNKGNPVPLSNNTICFTGLIDDNVNKIQDTLSTHP